MAADTVEEHSVEEVVANAPTEISADEATEFGDQLAADVDRGDAEWAYVYFDVEIDGRGEENYAWLVDTDDGWKIGLLAVFGP